MFLGTGYTTSYTSPPPLESVKDSVDKETTIEPSSSDEKKSPRLRRKSKSKEVLTDDDTDIEYVRPSRNASATPTRIMENGDHRRASPHVKNGSAGPATEEVKSMDGYEVRKLNRLFITLTGRLISRKEL